MNVPPNTTLYRHFYIRGVRFISSETAIVVGNVHTYWLHTLLATRSLSPPDIIYFVVHLCTHVSPIPFSQWKFGKCRKCNKPQGRLAAGGTFSNPGQSKAMCKDGKKHRFKFSKCQKCGKSEFA